MRGRKPAPTALKILRGNPGRRPLNRREPAPARATDLSPPPELTGVAAEEWRRLAPKLSRLGLLTEIDDRALIGYCVTWARWLEAEAHLRDHGMVPKGKRGAPFFVAVRQDRRTDPLAAQGMDRAVRDDAVVTRARQDGSRRSARRPLHEYD